MNRSLIAWLAATAAVAIIVTSCGDTESVADGAASPVSITAETTETSSTSATAPPTNQLGIDPDVHESNEAGLGDPAWVEGELSITDVRPLTATVRQDANGCWIAQIGEERVLLALPPGFAAPAGESQRLVGPDGFEVVDGTSIDGTGQIVRLQDIPGDTASRWGNLLAFCATTTTDAGAVVAFTTVVPAFDPNELGETELVAMLADATLSQAWGCGYGFAVSTPDQRVGLFLYADAAPAAAETIVLPDPRWSATMSIGRDLFAQHCDDVIELWEPETIVAAQWELTAGSFELAARAPTPEGCGQNVVTTRLVGAVVTTPLGDVPLGDLDLVNEAWGCFAG